MVKEGRCRLVCLRHAGWIHEAGRVTGREVSHQVVLGGGREEGTCGQKVAAREEVEDGQPVRAGFNQVAGNVSQDTKGAELEIAL